MGPLTLYPEESPRPARVEVGQFFANRRALSDARVHRPLQAGICGIRERGAESIVVGWNEDDRDHGDEIVFTGRGGRALDAGRQVEHRRFERGNAALVTGMTTGRPDGSSGSKGAVGLPHLPLPAGALRLIGQSTVGRAVREVMPSLG
ncbi:YDG/SRA domain-containing protein [Kitasatospora aureofaciens]|uniref:YDG/SRA domain-containing protein n=1 Tax=Kitasatospora aureofaciens TaxID=1894 RepID=UPI0037C5910F